MIVSSAVEIDTIDGAHRYIRLSAIDHLSITYYRTHMQADLTADANALLAQFVIEQDELLSDTEIRRWISEMEAGGDPWHIMPYVNSTPEYNTWETAASQSLRHWLALPSRQDLLGCNISVNSTSNKDVDDLLLLAGSIFTTSELRGEIQIAIDTEASLNEYVPSVTL